jgi:pimeloyl-ACP methyl ester carboxylesterase
LPVLFVLGKWDAAVPPEDGWKQCYLPQMSYIHMLDKSGHMGMIEEAEKSNQLLSDYLLQTL